MIWIEDAHCNGKRFVVHSDEKLTAFLKLELVIRACGDLVKINDVQGETRQIKRLSIAFGSLNGGAAPLDEQHLSISVRLSAATIS